MLLGLKELDKLEIFLDKMLVEGTIRKYRIYLNLNTTLSVDIVGNENNELKKEIENSGLVDISVDEWISYDEYESDKYYKQLFEKKIDIEHRRRLVNLIENKHTKNQNDLPVVTFYSYKGGVGRTTSLISFANYYAYHYKKKIVILDFDFEAPGFTNYFDFSLDDLENKNGVLEYLLDKEASKEKLNLIHDYMIDVSKEYSGDGSIYVMPSGNLFGEENLTSYIEALARVDINSTDTITNQILGLIKDIKEAIEPDVILIDSRTGFNDIFGLLINRISHTIVGLFEGNKQTEPGLKLFLREIYQEHQNPINPIVVNSLVHKGSGYSKHLKYFTETVNNYLIEITGENPSPSIFDLRNSNILGNLGTIEDDRDDYFEFIKENTPNDYKSFFDKLIELIENKKEINNDDSKNTNEKSIEKGESESPNTESIEDLKKSLLTNLDKNYPKSYAEEYKQEIYNTEFFNQKFFFRKSMEDIFNFDKFLLIGGKGTGKTMFYTALDNKDFLKTLQDKADKKTLNYSVVQAISLTEDSEGKKYFQVSNFTQRDAIFYKNFWMIYILNSIIISNNGCLKEYSISTELTELLPQELKASNSAQSKAFFEKIINNNKLYRLIEDELEKIDVYLHEKNINLMVVFDQLDHIVKPIEWTKAVSPLIDYCRSMPYKRIQPKIFVRRDLFDKYIKLTNKNALESKSINLEWSIDEVFAFFFKIVFAYSKKEFFMLMRKYNDFREERISAIQKNIEKQNSYNQIKLDIHWIKSLVTTFFGKYPHKHNSDTLKSSETYDWFYYNLKDSNDTISLRPFLDLIQFAMERAFNNTNEYHPKPILGAFFYDHAEVREKYVDRYFNDLASEEGNEDFRMIIEHIKNSSKFPKEFKQREFNEEKFNQLLTYLLSNQELKLNSKSIEEVEEILRTNGVLLVTYMQRGNKKYSFAYLYKYYLGLKR